MKIFYWNIRGITTWIISIKREEICKFFDIVSHLILLTFDITCVLYDLSYLFPVQLLYYVPFNMYNCLHYFRSSLFPIRGYLCPVLTNSSSLHLCIFMLPVTKVTGIFYIMFDPLYFSFDKTSHSAFITFDLMSFCLYFPLCIMSFRHFVPFNIFLLNFCPIQRFSRRRFILCRFVNGLRLH